MRARQRIEATFLSEASSGLMLSLISAGLAAVFAVFFEQQAALKLTVTMASLLYVAHGLRCSGECAGRLLAACAWSVAAVAVWSAPVGLSTYVAMHAGLACCVRAPFVYTSPLSALADLCLAALAVLAGVGAAFATGSVFLATWCFFLVRALHVSIPSNLAARSSGRRPRGTSFDEAHRAAKAALDALASRR